MITGVLPSTLATPLLANPKDGTDRSPRHKPKCFQDAQGLPTRIGARCIILSTLANIPAAGVIGNSDAWGKEGE